MASTMKAFAVREYKPLADLSALQELRLPKPTAGPRDLVVRVRAVATNPIDYKALANLGKPDAPFERGPLVVGWDAAGVVEAVGDKASLFKPGDEVMFAGDIGRAGSFAEFVAVDERIVGPKPPGLSWAEAAAVPLTGLTAWEALFDQLRVPPKKADNAGRTILITGGAGGVSTAAVQLAKHVLGLTVIATASRATSSAYVRELGADHVINHHKPLTAQLQALGVTEVDYVLHAVDLTPALFTEFTALVKPFGAIVSVWPDATVDLMQLFWKSIRFAAVLMFTRPGLQSDAKAAQHDALVRLAELHGSGVLTARAVNKPLPLNLANLKRALALQASGKAVGKITLTL